MADSSRDKNQRDHQPLNKREDSGADALPQADRPTVDWQTFAAFTIEFQAGGEQEQETQYRTLVRQVATDHEEIWSGMGANDLQRWLRSQLTHMLPTEAITAVDIAPEDLEADTRESPVIPVIENLYVLQPAVTATAMGLHKPHRLFPSPLQADCPFSLAVTFGLQEPAILATQTVSYHIECHARSLSSGDIISLGEVANTPLWFETSAYTAHLPTAQLKKGLYRLHVFLQVDGVRALPSFLEVPVLQVV